MSEDVAVHVRRNVAGECLGGGVDDEIVAVGILEEVVLLVVGVAGEFVEDERSVD